MVLFFRIASIRAKRKEKITFNSERPKEAFQGVRRVRIFHENTR